MYKLSDDLITSYPGVTSISEYQLQQLWNLEFKKQISDGIDLEEISQSLSDKQFKVDLKIENNNCLVATTVFEVYDSYSHLSLPLIRSHKMLKILEEKIGEIDTINGQSIEGKRKPWRIGKLV
jgi:hypothetical protein